MHLLCFGAAKGCRLEYARASASQLLSLSAQQLGDRYTDNAPAIHLAVHAGRGGDVQTMGPVE